MVDSSTDTSNKDIEAIYVHYLPEGKLVNAFLCVEELQLVTAIGHKEAMERGNALAFQ